MAKQIITKSIGMKSRSKPARIGFEVVGFMDAEKRFTITKDTPVGGDIDLDSIILTTSKGKYTLTKSPTANRYQGECNGIKVHVTLKAISGKIIYWIKK